MSELIEDGPAKIDKFKRKRKKSFLKNARKYAKKGCFGRGSNLDPDTYQYFVRIMEVFREGFETDEDKAIFVNNVFEQTTDQELTCCCNQVGCRVVESLLPFASDAVLQRFMKVFGDELRPLCCDRFASHVVEVLVKQSAGRTDVTFADFTVKVSKFLLNNLEDYLWDTYGNHVIRTCLETLALNLSDESTTIVKDYAERVNHWPQFSELCNTDVTSAFLQVLLKALRQVDKKTLKLVLGKLMEQNFCPPTEHQKTENMLPNIFLSKPAIMVLETALEVAKTKKFTQIYLKCFAGRLIKLAITRSTNFTVQKLVLNCKEKSEFEAIFEELKDSFDDVIGAGHTGILWALGQGCKNFATRQGIYVQSLMKSLNCFQPDEKQNSLVLCLCKFQKLDVVEGAKTDNLHRDKLNLHGTLILQLILEFNKPIKIVNSILSMEQDVLKGLFSNTMGSHIVDSYVKSTFVGEKSRERLVRKMKGTYQELAFTKYGSRSFEAIWNAANIKNKLSIMDELAYKDGAWSNSDHGKIVANKINLDLFKRNKEEWKNSLNTTDKVEGLFADILK